MILLIDVGNTRIKWAESVAGELAKTGSAIHEGRVDSLLDGLWSQRPAPDHIWVASVAGSAFDAQLTSWLQRVWGRTPRYVTPEAQQCGVVNGYRQPERLGADRWAAVIGARHAAPNQAVCIVDCGSAITIDALDSDGCYRGGVILPGITMMRRSLRQGTGLLPNVATSELTVFARDTETAIGAGTLLGAVGMVEQIFGRMARELGAMELILTGGDASQLAAHLRPPFVLEPNLVLSGLHKLAAEASR